MSDLNPETSSGSGVLRTSRDRGMAYNRAADRFRKGSTSENSHRAVSPLKALIIMPDEGNFKREPTLASVPGDSRRLPRGALTGGMKMGIFGERVRSVLSAVLL